MQAPLRGARREEEGRRRRRKAGWAKQGACSGAWWPWTRVMRSRMNTVRISAAHPNMPAAGPRFWDGPVGPPCRLRVMVGAAGSQLAARCLRRDRAWQLREGGALVDRKPRDVVHLPELRVRLERAALGWSVQRHRVTGCAPSGRLAGSARRLGPRRRGSAPPPAASLKAQRHG